MKKHIVFRGRDRSEVFETHIEQQLANIEKYLENEPSPVNIGITVDYHDTHKFYKVTAYAKSPHYNCTCDHEGPDFFAEVNEVTDRLYDKLRKQHRRLVDEHKDGCGKECKEEFYAEINEESLVDHIVDKLREELADIDIEIDLEEDFEDEE
jgi:ribosomal subunit interface protein